MRRRNRTLIATLTIVMAMVLAACGSSKSKSTDTTAAGAATATAGGGTLHLAYLGDMSVPDPDVFYDIEGNTVILSTYEGLVKYAPDSTKIVPGLATSWDISPDKLTSTFHLRQGVTFHDGTPFDSSAVKTAFQRRLDVG